jgi:K+-transporting ATPase ATPase A chain
MHDSFTPLGGLVPLVNMQLGEVDLRRRGRRLYGMLVMVVLTVFIAGLMVGAHRSTWARRSRRVRCRWPCCTSSPCRVDPRVHAIASCHPRASQDSTTRPHGLSEILYAFSSATANNGSAFAGLTGATYYYNTQLGIAMLFGRFC